MKQMPFDGDFFLLSSTQSEFDNQSIQLNMSPNDLSFSPLNHNASNSLTDFFLANDPSLTSNELSMEITMEDIKTFQKTHDDYSSKLYQVLITFQYDSIEKLIEQFWSLTNIHHAQNTDPTSNGTRRSPLREIRNHSMHFRSNISLEISSNLYITFHSRSISFILSEILSNINRPLFSGDFHSNTHRMFSFSSSLSLTRIP